MGRVDSPGGYDHGTTRGSDPVVETIRALHEMALSDGALDETLRRVAELAAATLPFCDMACVTLIENEQQFTSGATDDRARLLGDVQYTHGTGPCLDAWRTSQLVHVRSTRTETRWPDYARTAVEVGMLSAIAVPLVVQGKSIGCLNLYSEREHAFDEHDDQVGKLFADQAAVALANARTHAAAVRLAHQLQQALESRGFIEQAKGILMARHRCSPDAAFNLLVQRSQHQNRKLRQVAQDIIAETMTERTSN